MPFTSVSAIEGLHAWQSDLYFVSPLYPPHPPTPFGASVCVCLISLTLTHVGQGTSFKLTLARTEADWCCPKNTHSHTHGHTHQVHVVWTTTAQRVNFGEVKMSGISTLVSRLFFFFIYI